MFVERERSFATSATFGGHLRVPLVGGRPEEGSVFCDQRTGLLWYGDGTEWKSSSLVRDGLPGNASEGDMAYDGSTLKAFVGGAWRVKQAAQTNPSIAEDLNLRGFKVINVVTPSSSGAAANKAYAVDALVGATISTDGSRTMTANLNASSNKVKNVGLPRDDADAATKEAVDTALAGFPKRDGSSGALTNDLGGFKLTGLGTPSGDDESSTKGYSETAFSNAMKRDGSAFDGELNSGGFRVFGVAEPQDGTDAATRGYAETVRTGSGMIFRDGVNEVSSDTDWASKRMKNLGGATRSGDAVRSDFVAGMEERALGRAVTHAFKTTWNSNEVEAGEEWDPLGVEEHGGGKNIEGFVENGRKVLRVTSWGSQAALLELVVVPDDTEDAAVVVVAPGGSTFNAGVAFGIRDGSGANVPRDFVCACVVTTSSEAKLFVVRVESDAWTDLLELEVPDLVGSLPSETSFRFSLVGGRLSFGYDQGSFVEVPFESPDLSGLAGRAGLVLGHKMQSLATMNLFRLRRILFESLE